MNIHDPSGADVRRRNALLEALELFRREGQEVRLSSLIAFLYICENEGLCITELADLSGVSLATASRAARSLISAAEPGALPPASGLVRLGRRGKIRPIELTEEGRRVRRRLDDVISNANPIVCSLRR
jgi:DNA-binding MarR family transcriptional regulator